MAQSEEPMYWFVMRDLKRPNAKEPAYKQLGELSIEVFTPLKWHLSIKRVNGNVKNPFHTGFTFCT